MVHALNSLLQLPPHINIDFANLSFTKAILISPGPGTTDVPLGQIVGRWPEKKTGTAQT